jgi:hypothetical protein
MDGENDRSRHTVQAFDFPMNVAIAHFAHIWHGVAFGGK